MNTLISLKAETPQHDEEQQQVYANQNEPLTREKTVESCQRKRINLKPRKERNKLVTAIKNNVESKMRLVAPSSVWFVKRTI